MSEECFQDDACDFRGDLDSFQFVLGVLTPLELLQFACQCTDGFALASVERQNNCSSYGARSKAIEPFPILYRIHLGDGCFDLAL